MTGVNTGMERRTILPGATIGILGGGQLGRMIALEGRRMGYRLITLDPTPDSPCGQVADSQVVAAYDDAAAARQFAQQCDVITYEFENVDAQVAAILEVEADVPQGSRLLRLTQHRVREKSAIQAAGIPVAPFLPLHPASAEDLLNQASAFGYPSVLKTTTGGYDGKGQWLLHSDVDARAAWRDVAGLVASWPRAREDAPGGTPGGIGAPGDTTGGNGAPSDTPLILEQFIPFVKELSVVVARSRSGETRTFPVSENIHHHHILHLSIVPARIPDAVQRAAEETAQRIAQAVDAVGLLAIEMFLTADHQLFVNELAPRPHNSGHFTYDACVTSQFEQHIRAICDLPLGDASLLSPVVMVNVLGEHLDPLLHAIPTLPPNMKWHLYGKRDAKPGRKMGHVNVMGPDVEACLAQIEALQIWI